MATPDLRSYFQVKSKAPPNTIPDLTRVSQNITPADADAVNKELKAVTSVKKKESVHRTSHHVLKSKLENML